MKRIFHPVLLCCFLLWVAGCAPLPSSPSAGKGTQEVVVFAAASLTDVFGSLAADFQQKQPGATVIFNFAGSQQLASQLAQGARADIFASADQRQMEAVVQAGWIDPASVALFACNRLVAVVSQPGLASLGDLARPGVKIVIGSEAVPVGVYTRAFLDAAVTDPAYGEAFRRGVLANVVSYEQSVRAVLSKVRLGEADAGIVYTTDAQSAPDVAVLEIPAHLNQTAGYQIAILRDSGVSDLARQFVEFVRSPAGGQRLTDAGFSTACVAAGGQAAP